jgi:hypothetical protein
MGTLSNREVWFRSGKKISRAEVHDLPALGAALQFEAQLAFAPRGVASATRFVLHLEVGEQDSAIIFLGNLQDAEGDAEAFIVGEIGVELVLESPVPVHLAAIEGGEQMSLGVRFETVANGRENCCGGALIESGGCVGLRRHLLPGGKREDKRKKQERNNGKNASDHVAISWTVTAQ